MCERGSPSRKLSANRTRTWTAPAAAVERERTRRIARIGNNPNQIARWANTDKTATEAVEVIAHLVATDVPFASCWANETTDGKYVENVVRRWRLQERPPIAGQAQTMRRKTKR